jgi:hypothetical protein
MPESARWRPEDIWPMALPTLYLLCILAMLSGCGTRHYDYPAERGRAWRGATYGKAYDRFGGSWRRDTPAPHHERLRPAPDHGIKAGPPHGQHHRRDGEGPRYRRHHTGNPHPQRHQNDHPPVEGRQQQHIRPPSADRQGVRDSAGRTGHGSRRQAGHAGRCPP